MTIEQLAKREYLRGLLDGQERKVFEGHDTEVLDFFYAYYRKLNPEVSDDIRFCNGKND